MLIITQNTEQNFLQELQLCMKKMESWRCIIFELSKCAQKPDGWFSIVTDKVNSCLGDNGGKIFLYEDGDLYILTRNATHKAFAFLTANLSLALTPISFQEISELYELPIDGKAIVSLLEDKRAEKRREKQQEKPKSKNLPKIDPLRDPHYTELISSLPARREKRGMPAILVVEDDLFSQRLVAKALGPEFQILTAEDAGSALETYILNAPDMLFLDIGLPDANGLDLIGKIFKIDHDAYIVMLSGNGHKDNVVKAIQDGAKGFVSKPFAQDRLFHYVGKNPFIHEKRSRG